MQYFYFETAEKRLYTPMIRALLKDTKSSINIAKQSAMCNLQTIFNFEVSGKMKMKLLVPVTLHAT